MVVGRCRALAQSRAMQLRRSASELWCGRGGLLTVPCPYLKQRAVEGEMLVTAPMSDRVLGGTDTVHMII